MCFKTLFELIRGRIEQRQLNKLKNEVDELKTILPLEAQITKAQIEALVSEERIADNKRKVTLVQTKRST